MFQQFSDEELIKLMLTNSKKYDDYFLELYGRHSKWIYNKALQFVTVAEAEDVLQEVFVKICLNLSKFKFESKFSTWAFTITYNTCINAVKKRNKKIDQENRYAEFQSSLDVMDEEGTDHAIEAISFERLKELMEIIDPEDKQILLMKYQDDLSIKELGEIMSLSDGAVKMRLLRAKKRLRTLYENKFNYV